MDLIVLLGFAASILITIAYIPQTIKTVKTKSTHDISLHFSIILFSGLILYTIYGVELKSIPLIFSSVAGSILIFIILFHKLRYG